MIISHSSILLYLLALQTSYASTCRPNFIFENGKCIFKFTSRDPLHCGSINHVCGKFSSSLATVCMNGRCIPICEDDYKFDGRRCRLVLSDVNNCGHIGNTCPPHSHSTAICNNGSCRQGKCIPGFTRDSANTEIECSPIKIEAAAPIIISQLVSSVGMCPEKQQACPVRNSQSSQSITLVDRTLECVSLDSLENCGSCGRDCTSIASAIQVICQKLASHSSSCKVLTCQAGFKVSLDDRRCKRIGKKTN